MRPYESCNMTLITNPSPSPTNGHKYMKLPPHHTLPSLPTHGVSRPLLDTTIIPTITPTSSTKDTINNTTANSYHHHPSLSGELRPGSKIVAIIGTICKRSCFACIVITKHDRKKRKKKTSLGFPLLLAQKS